LAGSTIGSRVEGNTFVGSSPTPSAKDIKYWRGTESRVEEWRAKESRGVFLSGIFPIEKGELSCETRKLKNTKGRTHFSVIVLGPRRLLQNGQNERRELYG
jgi:hypothetical protein